jgi:O-antigen/teichoic acid export membrane protein
MGSRLSGRVFDLLKALILARLLTPRDFGLFGIVMLALATLDTFSQTGINAALIQRRGDIRPYLGTAWTVQGLRGIVLAVLLYLAAPAVALFFREPDVADLLRFVSAILVMQGFVNTGIVFFTRDMDFERAFVFEVGSGGLSLAAGIVLAYQLRSPWALVWANFVGAVARVVLSFLLSPIRPRLELRKDRAGELFAFGRWMSGYAIASWIWQNVDRLVLGRVIGAAPLGVYQMAQRIASMPVSEVAIASMGLTLPAYSRMQSEPGRLGRSFLDVFETVMSFVAPMAVFLAVAAPEVVHGLLGGRWASAIGPLQIVSAAALFTALDIVATPLLVAVGQPRVEFWKNCARSAVVMITVLPLTMRYGVGGACASFLLGSLTPLFFWGPVVRIARVGWGQLLERTALVGVMVAAVSAAVLATRLAFGTPGAAALAAAGIAAASSWLIAGYLLRSLAGRGIFLHIIRLKAGILETRLGS